MRFLTALSALLATLTLTATLASAQTSTATLTGKMAGYNYVFGAPWNCTANIPSMGGMPARTETTTVTFDVAPNDVMHVHMAGTTSMGDQYFGYSTRGNMYWTAISTSNGSAVSETSTDGRMYRGSLNMGPMNGTVQDTYAKTDDNHVMITSIGTVAGRSATTTVSCSR